MEGVSIVPTEILQALIGSVEDLKLTMASTIAELKDTRKPYLTAQEVMLITGFGKNWVNNNKHIIGYSSIGGCLRFKRSDVVEFMGQNYFKAKRK